MDNIKFYIGPSNKSEHELVVDYLNKNNYYISSITYAGDHYSDIGVTGDYNKFFTEVIQSKNTNISVEHFEE